MSSSIISAPTYPKIYTFPYTTLFRSYADDFIITSAEKEVLEREIKPMLVEFLAERGLELSDEKTVITHIDDGFDFRSEEHTSELQSRFEIVCRLLLEKKMTCNRSSTS